MKVLHVVTTLAHGGAQATVLEACRELPEDIEVVVAAGPDDTGEGSLRAAFEAASIRVVEVRHLRRWMAGLAEVRALASLVGLIRAERPDVVHTHSSKAGALGRLAAAIAGVPAVHTVHGWSFNGRGPLATTAIVAIERFLARLSDVLVVVSEADQESGLRRGIGTGARYRVIRAGVDLDVPRDAARHRGTIRADLGLAPSTFVIGTVARLDPAKDVPFLIEGFAASGLAEQGARLVIVGEGAERSRIDEAIRRTRLSGSVDLLGHRADGARLVAAFDCFALTSRWEGMPRALIEAMAAEVPVVATPAGGVGRLLDGGANGLLVRRRASAELAQALRAVHRDAAGAEDRARAAAALVEGFSAERMRRQLHEVWRRTASRTGAEPQASDEAAARSAR